MIQYTMSLIRTPIPASQWLIIQYHPNSTICQQYNMNLDMGKLCIHGIADECNRENTLTKIHNVPSHADDL